MRGRRPRDDGTYAPLNTRPRCGPRARRPLQSVALGGAALLSPIALGFPFHPPEALVVVGKLLHVRERDLAGEDRVVSGDVRLRIVRTMFELNIHAGAELLEVVAAPVDADRVADTP